MHHTTQRYRHVGSALVALAVILALASLALQVPNMTAAIVVAALALVGTLAGLSSRSPAV